MKLNAKMTRDINVNTATVEDLLKWYNENSGEKKARTTLGSESDARKKCAELKQAIQDLSSPKGSKGKDGKGGKADAGKKEGETKGPGKKSQFSGKVIVKSKDWEGQDPETKKPKNPRREGTHGHRSFALLKAGMTYEQYIAAGGRQNDLAWDVEKGYVTVK